MALLISFILLFILFSNKISLSLSFINLFLFAILLLLKLIFRFRLSKILFESLLLICGSLLLLIFLILSLSFFLRFKLLLLFCIEFLIGLGLKFLELESNRFFW
jgi:hypothetical protein